MNILITGGSGSFGQRFTKYLLDNNLSERICIYSRDEWKQAQMRRAFDNDERLRFFIGDVRDYHRLVTAMRGNDVVIHAAALKRVEVCEYDAVEVTKTNVNGAVNVIEAAHETHIVKVVALSTDKAVSPVNAYGASKLLAEKLFIAANHTYGKHGPKYCLVRYGNVWKSRGSVVPVWKDILQDSDTVPVTDPDATRYFMYMEEACELVQNAIMNGKAGDVMIPLLPAYRVGDLAEAMGAKMNIIGMNPREKLHETMDGVTDSSKAYRMSVKELQEALKHG